MGALLAAGASLAATAGGSGWNALHMAFSWKQQAQAQQMRHFQHDGKKEQEKEEARRRAAARLWIERSSVIYQVRTGY